MWLEDIGQAQTGLHSTPGGLASGTSQGFRHAFPSSLLMTNSKPAPAQCHKHVFPGASSWRPVMGSDGNPMG